MFSGLIVALVIGLFAFGFWLYDKNKKKTEKANRSSSALKQKKVHHISELNSRWNDQNMRKIENWVLSHKGRIVEGEDQSMMVYFGESGKSQFNGFLNIPIDQLPVRLVFFNGNGDIKVRFDEDFGFQMFMGAVKREFISRYKNRFKNIETGLKSALNE